MSPAVQVVAVIIAAGVFVVRLAVALYQARRDGQLAARRARQEHTR